MTEDKPLTSASLIQNLSPEDRKILEKGLNLLEIKEVPGAKEDPSLIGNFVYSTNRLINRYGEDWIKQHRIRLVKELEILATM